MRRPSLTSHVARGLTIVANHARQIAMDYQSDYEDHGSRDRDEVDALWAAVAYLERLTVWYER